METSAPSGKRTLVYALGVGIGTMLVFLPALWQGFITYDDPYYVTTNPWVRNGLSWYGIKQAFAHAHVENWQPLTWISHMLDSSLYGLSPWGHHLSSLLLHSANASLLFSLLVAMTGSWSRSLVATALFAVHPLRVEPVAWITSRKDVLSLFFFLAAIWFYVRFALSEQLRKSTPRFYYVASLLSFALGLMSKPVVITLPVLLLFLDYWPLHRFKDRSFLKLALAKIPYVGVAILAAVVTVLAKQEGMQGGENLLLPLSARVQHAVVSYADYLWAFFLPVRLSVFYPHPVWHPMAEIVIASFVLLVISIVAFVWRRSQPWLLVGWLWYLCSLLPMIGLIQFGRQGLADRFMYIPSIGLVFMLVWGLGHFVAKWRLHPSVPIAATVAATVACVALTTLQLQRWASSESLFKHCLAVTERNDVAHLNLGTALRDEGRLDEALEHFKAAVALEPEKSVSGHFFLGALYLQMKRLPDAITHLSICTRLQPSSPRFRFTLASALQQANKIEQAIAEYQETLRREPGHIESHIRLGNIAYDANQFETARAHFSTVVQSRPSDAGARNGLASALFCLGQLDEAAAHYQAALSLDPTNKDAAQNLRALMRIKAGLPAQ